MSGIAPAESDGAIGERDQAMVRDRDTMGVLAQIAKCVLRAAKRTFRVNHPFGAEQRTKPGGERFGIRERGECSVETEFVLRMQFPQAVHELAPENFTENIDRQEESSAASQSIASGPEPDRRLEQHNERADDAGVSGSRCEGH